MQHLLPHARMLAADRAIYNRPTGFRGDLARGAWRNRAINDGKTRSVGTDVIYDLAYELVGLEGEADMHNIAPIDWRR